MNMGRGELEVGKKEKNSKDMAAVFLLLLCYWEITSAARGPTSFWQVLANKL